MWRCCQRSIKERPVIPGEGRRNETEAALVGKKPRKKAERLRHRHSNGKKNERGHCRGLWPGQAKGNSGGRRERHGSEAVTPSDNNALFPL